MMNPRNPLDSSSQTQNPTMETENPSQEQDIGSSSRTEINTESAKEEEHIGSSSRIPNRIGSSSRIPSRIGSSSSLRANAPSSRRTESLGFSTRLDKFDEKTLIDPATKDTYVLEKFIGHFYNYRQCRVYKALYSQYSSDFDICIPSGYVTLKTVDMNKSVNAFDDLRRQYALSLDYHPDAKVIGFYKNFITDKNLYCVSLPYMSEGSVIHILFNRTVGRLPEDQISAILKVVLLALRDELHIDPIPKAHNTLNAGDIFVHIDDVTGEMSIKLAYAASVYFSEDIDDRRLATDSWKDVSSILDPRTIAQWGAAPEVFREGNEDYRGPKSDIWLFGLTALDLAYGNLPVNNRGDLDYIIKKLREKQKFPKSLEKMLSKRDGKLKKVMDFGKRKRRVFSMEFEEMVLACLRENPEHRPTAAQLLNAPFFVTAADRFKNFVLSGKDQASADTGAVEQRRGN